MKKEDLANFTLLMKKMGKATTEGSNEDRNPSDERISIYFDFLADVPFDQVALAANKHFNKSRKFPGICDLNGNAESDIESQAIDAFETIGKAFLSGHHPDGGQHARIAIDYLKKVHKENIAPFLYQWGWDIVHSENPTATRAQFIKSFKASKANQIDQDVERRLIGDSAKLLN